MSGFIDDIDQLGTAGQNADEPKASLDAITMDGQGYGKFRDLYSSENDPAALESGTFTYTVADDVRLTVFVGGGEIHGIVSPDGNVFTIADTSSADPGILIGIKMSPGYIPSKNLLLLLH